MHWTNPMVITPLLSGFVFILAGFVMTKFPPKEINGIYGYRTRTSMKSQVHWDFAQRYSAKELMIWGTLQCLTSLTGLVIKVDVHGGAAVGIGVVIIFSALPIIRTERALRSRFGRE